MPRSVGVAQITIPSSYQRLRRHGYCATISMEDVWQLVVPADQAKINSMLNGSTQTDIPIVYISRVSDNIPNA